jgi:hypothetical protein
MHLLTGNRADPIRSWGWQGRCIGTTGGRRVGYNRTSSQAAFNKAMIGSGSTPKQGAIKNACEVITKENGRKPQDSLS